LAPPDAGHDLVDGADGSGPLVDRGMVVVDRDKIFAPGVVLDLGARSFVAVEGEPLRVRRGVQVDALARYRVQRLSEGPLRPAGIGWAGRLTAFFLFFRHGLSAKTYATAGEAGPMNDGRGWTGGGRPGAIPAAAARPARRRSRGGRRDQEIRCGFLLRRPDSS